jgi:hypothetical protein
MPRSARAVAAGLREKGFRDRENDHTFFHLYVDDKKTIVSTKISHGEKEIGDTLLALMARQVKLSRKQFLDLVDCPLTLAQYIELLQSAGVVAKPEQAADKRAPRPSTKQ